MNKWTAYSGISSEFQSGSSSDLERRRYLSAAIRDASDSSNDWRGLAQVSKKLLQQENCVDE